MECAITTAEQEKVPLLPLLHGAPSQDEGSQYTRDGTIDINNQPALKQSTGKWRACIFILGAGFSECLALDGISMNLVTYLTSVLHESNIDAARNVSTWYGSCYFTPLIGAFLADTYWGRYWTVAIFLSVYTIGMLLMTASSSIPFLLHSSGGIHRVAVYMGLYLVALGAGGIKPCTSAIGADQFDSTDPAEQAAKGSFFNWFYFAMNIGSLLSATVIVWVQDNIGWGAGFTTAAALVGLAFAVFVAGRRVYRYRKLGESPMARVSQVVVAAVRNYHLKLPDDVSSSLHKLPSQSEANYKIHHTSEFRFFDKAAMVLPPTSDEIGAGVAAQTSPWRLCTVSQVEELKMLLRMLPIWASMMFFSMVSAQMSSTFVEQGMAMDNHVGSFAVPPASLCSFEVVTTLLLIPIYDSFIVPLARRVTGESRGFSQLQRLGIGLALSVVGMVYSALLETKRLEVMRDSGGLANRSAAAPMSIMWQAPSYAIFGAAEVFTNIGMLEFFYDESPDTMKSLCTALGQLAIAAGNYLNSAALALVAYTTACGGAPGWIPDNLNEGHLDYFFWLMAAFGALNLVLFLHCSTSYRGSRVQLR